MFSWEQRKLSDYLTTSPEKNISGLYTKEDVLSVSGDVGIVNQIEFQGRSFAGASVLNYGIVETGDVVYTKSPLRATPYGIIKANKGKPGIVSTLYAIYHPTPLADPDFIQCYFEQDARVNNYLHPLVNKGAKNDMKVSADNALKGIVHFPSVKEQQTISAFFKSLDDLITLHQRENSQTICQAKKEHGKEAAAWEQRKLETAFDFSVSNNTLSRAELNYEDGEVKSVHYGDVLIKYGSVLDAQIDEIPFITGKKGMDFSGQWLQEGDIIIADTAEDETTGKATEIRHLGAIPVVSGLHTIVCRPTTKMAPYYLGYYLNSDSYHSQLLPLMQGIKVLSLSRSNLIKTEIKYPKSQEEQKQIGCFFRSLDDLITLHQREHYH